LPTTSRHEPTSFRHFPHLTCLFNRWVHWLSQAAACAPVSGSKIRRESAPDISAWACSTPHIYGGLRRQQMTAVATGTNKKSARPLLPSEIPTHFTRIASARSHRISASRRHKAEDGWRSRAHRSMVQAGKSRKDMLAGLVNGRPIVIQHCVRCPTRRIETGPSCSFCNSSPRTSLLQAIGCRKCQNRNRPPIPVPLVFFGAGICARIACI